MTPSQPEPAPPDAEAPERLTHAQAVSDARYFFDAIEATHPDPYTAIGGKVAFHRRKQALLTALRPEGLSTVELGRQLSDFASALGDGHTFISGDAVRWNDPDPFLPLAWVATRDAVYLAGHDYADLDRKRGHRLTAVGGFSIETIAERIGRRLPAENVMGIQGRLIHFVRSRAMLTRLVPELEDQKTLELSLTSPRGRVTTVAIPFEGSSKPRGQWRAPPRTTLDFSPGKDPYETRFFRNDKVGYLRVGDMMGREGFEAMHRQGWGDARAALTRWHAQRDRPMPEDIEEALANVPSLIEATVALLEAMKAKGTTALIVDLRGNTGGVTSTFRAVCHLIHGDVAWSVPFAEHFATRVSPLLLDKYQTTLEEYRVDNDAPDLKLGDYLFGEDPPDATTARQQAVASWKATGMGFADTIDSLGSGALHTPARVMVLIDANTFSAGFHAMYFLDRLGAEVVGVPSMQSPNAFMEFTSFRLPASKLEGGISNSIQQLDPDNPTATVYPVNHEIDGKILARYDYDTQTALRWALDLLDAELGQ